MRSIVALCLAVAAPVISEHVGAQRPADVGGRKLTAITVADGITCAPTGNAYAYFFPSGRLKECPLARDTTLFGQKLPAQTWVQFTSEGRLRHAWLPQNVTLTGHTCLGRGYKKWSVLFHPSGSLAFCYLPEETVIEGAPCQRGTFWNELRGGGKSGVHFHANGRLARCQATRSFTHEGRQIKKWELVGRDSTGHSLPP